MTGFKTQDEWLDWGGTLGLEIRSPLFDSDTIPGVLSYPTPFADTPRNRRLLGFPAVRARRAGPVPAVEADLYIGGSLWRRGVLQYKDFDSAKGEYNYQFQADADALATRIQDVQLSELALGTLSAAGLPAETDDYVLFPVRNATFYDASNNPDWGKVVNYYAGGAFAVNQSGAATYTAVPMLKVVPLLRRVLGLYGYAVTGEWVEDPEIQKLVLYSLAALDLPAGTLFAADFEIARALPDVRVVELLLTLQQLFALGFVFNPVRKEVRIVPLRSVVANASYRPRTAGGSYRDLANEGDGYRLSFTPDNDDELLKSAPWPELLLAGAAEKIQPAADTLRMVREPDPRNGGRAWLIPAAEQKGYSARTDFEQADTRSSHLRFLFYRGLQPDANGAAYPLASSGTVNYAGATVGQYALEWGGAQGLYQQWHKPWLDFRANARTEERAITLTLAEFLTLDPAEKDMVQGLKFLWENVSVQVGGAETLAPATITYHQIAR